MRAGMTTPSSDATPASARDGAREATPGEVRAYAVRVRADVEAELDRIVPAESADPPSVHAAVRWSLFAPATRFRPLIVTASRGPLGAAPRRLVRTACALELRDTYPLVHDD